MGESGNILRLEDWLFRKEGQLDPGKMYYCLLNEREFHCYTDDTMNQIFETIQLKDVKSVKCLAASSRPTFFMEYGSGKTVSYSSSNIYNIQKWITALGAMYTYEDVTLDSFKIMCLIGNGSSGKVFLARRKWNDDYVAIKIVDKVFYNGKRDDNRLKAERNALLKAKHEFITRLLFAFQTESKVYFVMEYLPGGDLGFHIARSAFFTRKQIVYYLAELAIAMRTVHFLGIVYRDLKPENILLDSHGHIKLADFGLACECGENGCEDPVLCGTCEYLAPEVIDSRNMTQAADWWAYGVIAFRLLCGRFPFFSPNKSRLFGMITSSEPHYPCGLDSSSKEFLSSLLCKDPSKRMDFATQKLSSHDFFSGINWLDISEKRHSPEYIPCTCSPCSTENFEESITSTPIGDCFVSDSLNTESEIPEFSYIETVLPICPVNIF